MLKAGLTFTDKYETTIREYVSLSAAKRSKIKEQKKSTAVHEYRPEDYGLSTRQIREEFAEYIHKYGL